MLWPLKRSKRAPGDAIRCNSASVGRLRSWDPSFPPVDAITVRERGYGILDYFCQDAKWFRFEGNSLGMGSKRKSPEGLGGRGRGSADVRRGVEDLFQGQLGQGIPIGSGFCDEAGGDELVDRRVLDGVAGRAALEFGNARRGLRVDGAAPIGGILRDGEGEQGPNA